VRDRFLTIRILRGCYGLIKSEEMEVQAEFVLRCKEFALFQVNNSNQTGEISLANFC
jgi:hypothetical protein